MKMDGGSPKEEVSGPTRQPEGCLARAPSWSRQAPSWMPGGPPRCPLLPINPPGLETLNREKFPCFAAATGRKPTEEKSHLRRADSTGEITSRKGRSSPSSSSSSRESSSPSSTSSPTSAPSPSLSNLISQLQLVL